MPDDDATARAAAQSWDAFYRQHTPYLQAKISSRYRHVSAEDVAHETMLLAWQQRDKIDHARSVRGYLLTIADHLIADLMRKEENERRAAFLLLPPETDDPEHDVIRQLEHRDAHRVVSGLPPSEREVVIDRFWANMGNAEIAELRGISASGVRQRWHRAREDFRSNFRKLGHAVIPAWMAAVEAVRRILHSSPQRETASGSVLAASAVASVVMGLSIMLPAIVITDPDQGRPDGPAIGTAVDFPDNGPKLRMPPTSQTPIPAQSGKADTPPTPPPREAATPTPVAPPSAELHLSPDSGGGRQQAHRVEWHTPLGPVVVEGESAGSRPASAHSCAQQAATCLDVPAIASEDAALP